MLFGIKTNTAINDSTLHPQSFFSYSCVAIYMCVCNYARPVRMYILREGRVSSSKNNNETRRNDISLLEEHS